MALTAFEIGEVLAEISPHIVGGRIQKIHQPSDRVLVFAIRVPGTTHRLLVSLVSETTRLHLSRHRLPNPSSPPPFSQYLRAHLEGAKINSVQQLSDDRVVAFHLSTQEGPRTLVCELTGKTADILVLNEHQQVLRSLNKRRGSSTDPYHPPVKRSDRTERGNLSRFTSVSQANEFPVSAAIEDHYQGKETQQAIEQAKEERLRLLKKIIKKEQRRLDAWREDLAKAMKYGDYARYGELIKGNLGSIKKGMAHITLLDYYDELMPEVTIPLDSTKSPHANMDEYFRKHRKYLAAERELKPRIAKAEHDLDALRKGYMAIQDGTDEPAPPSLTVRRPPIGATWRKTQASSERRRGPFRRFTSSDGLPIFVGRNARENDELTFGLAKSDDLWLHVRGSSGSHVVVRLGKGTEPPPDTLREAAILALLYSGLKRSGKGEVIYTRRKWVKKARGQAPGAVIVTQEKSISATLDKARLAALKARYENVQD